MSNVDYVITDAINGGEQPGDVRIVRDDRRNMLYKSADGLFEPTDHVIAAWCLGDGAEDTFTIGKLPDECLVREVSVVVAGTAGTAATTIAVGIAGDTGKYMAATSFTSSMDTAGVKTVTTVPAHETSARTVIATFSAAWDDGATALVAVRYIKLPAVPS